MKLPSLAAVPLLMACHHSAGTPMLESLGIEIPRGQDVIKEINAQISDNLRRMFEIGLERTMADSPHCEDAFIQSSASVPFEGQAKIAFQIQSPNPACIVHAYNTLDTIIRSETPCSPPAIVSIEDWREGTDYLYDVSFTCPIPTY